MFRSFRSSVVEHALGQFFFFVFFKYGSTSKERDVSLEFRFLLLPIFS